ncbi:MAG: restriction endonuclease subunit S [Thermoanaerobaculia bacterium]|nr:restriction endonuclease subunit S [Thermoanaerobaculia bacterium]
MSSVRPRHRPATWAEATIDDVASYVSRGKSPRYTDRSELPVVNQRCIRWSEIETEHLKFVHRDQFHEWGPERFIRAGDILWNSTGTGTIGRACLVQPEDSHPPKVVDSHVTVVRSRPDAVDAGFLHLWIRGPEVQAEILGLSTGSTNQIELNKSTVLSTRLPLPPLGEQKRIASLLSILLSRTEAVRAHLDRTSALLKRFRQAVLEAGVSGELTAEWREKRGGTYRSWTEVALENVALEVGTGSTPTKSHPEYYPQQGVPWIPSGLTALPLILTGAAFVSGLAIDHFRLKKWPAGTLLVALYGEGKTRGQVSELGIEATINQACAAIIVDPKKAERKFVRLSLEANYLKMRALAEGGSQPNLNLSKVRSFPIRLPPLPEQAEIVHRVNGLFALAASLEARIEAARAQVERLTPALLAKAFRGELVPQDPAEGTGAELLARIRAEKAPSRKVRRMPRTTDVGDSIEKPTVGFSAPELSVPPPPDPRVPKTPIGDSDDAETRGRDTAPLLLRVLHRLGERAAPADLWQASSFKSDIDGFYAQLRAEIAAGLLVEKVLSETRRMIEVVRNSPTSGAGP